jgi:hypothetical protein
MSVLFDDEVPVHYGYIFVSTEDDLPELMATRRGQQNGLCGAAVEGVLSLITGLHTGPVRLCVEWLDTAPALDPEWEDVVEVSFAPTQPDLTLSSFEYFVDVRLPAAGELRARYCSRGLDAAHQSDNSLDVLSGERYLLQLWPGPPAPDTILRQTSAYAAYWHDESRRLAPPPTPQERAAAVRAAAERAEQAAERAAEQRYLQRWGGRLPSPRLRELGGTIDLVARYERDLLDAFEALDATTQRDAARWLAHRAIEIAELDQKEWVRTALDAMDSGTPLPEPLAGVADKLALARPYWPGTNTAVFIVRLDAAGNRVTGDIDRRSFALPAIVSAIHPDPLRALVDTFSHAAATYEDRRQALVSEVRRRWLDQRG